MTRAVVVRRPGASPAVADIDLRPVGSGDVRIRTAAAGVCHSDLSMVNQTMKPDLPVVLGHEASGVVTEVGADVTDLRVGDCVVLNWAPPCRTCWHCERGEPWLCDQVAGAVSRPSGFVDGQPLNVALGVGAFAESIVADRSAVVPLPVGVDLQLAALLGCAVLTGVGAVLNTAGVRRGESVVVVGLGGVGLAAVAGARLAGAEPIVAVDRSADKEPFARAMGATEFIATDEVGAAVPREVRRLTDGRGADHAIECVGRPETIRLAWQASRRGGQCVVVGIGGRDAEVTFNAMELYHWNRRLTSSVYGSSDPERDLPLLAEHVVAGRLDLSSLVSHRITLEDVPVAFARMEAGVGARSLITFP